MERRGEEKGGKSSGVARDHTDGATGGQHSLMGGEVRMTDLELPYNNYLYEYTPLMSCKPIYSVYITIYKNDMHE